MANHFKARVRAHMEKTGLSYQAAVNDLRGRPAGSGSEPTAVIVPDFLARYKAPHISSIRIGRLAAIATSADPAIASRMARDKLGKLYAETTSVKSVVERSDEERTKQVIRVDPGEGALGRSVACCNCGRWLWSGTKEAEGGCLCGQPFGFVFVRTRRLDWRPPIGPRCMECGEESRLSEPHQGLNPWSILTPHLTACARHTPLKDENVEVPPYPRRGTHYRLWLHRPPADFDFLKEPSQPE
ncbi:MAG: hypothetical protein RL385_5651 [Pseudomonadota bacterium]